MSKAVTEVYKWLYFGDLDKEMYEEGSVFLTAKRLRKVQTSQNAGAVEKFCDMVKVTRMPQEEIKYKLEGDSSSVVKRKGMDEHHDDSGGV